MNALSRCSTRLLLALAAPLGLATGAWAQMLDPHGESVHGAIVSPHDLERSTNAANLPKLELTPQLLYQFLLAEIAGARSNVPLAARTYLDIAKSTRDPRIARRATEIALYARQPDQVLEAARIWAETDSDSPQAQQMLAGLLLNALQPEEAATHLAKLLALDKANLPDALQRLSRLLARYPDKTVALQLTDQLTAPYDDLAEAHWARAQAAINANQQARALAEAERAQALRPDWEQAVLFKAQLQQRTDNKQALATLGGFLKSHPKAREVRVAYARTLISEKNYEEARREFATLLNDDANDPEILYAVALLSLQLNDPVPAEKHLRHLLELGASDPNPLRYYLGQIAENTKRPEEAMRWFEAVTAGEQFLPSRMRIAVLLSQQGHLDEARRSLQQAAANPGISGNERTALLVAEAQLLRDAGRFGEAFELLNSGLAKEPEQPELLYETSLLAEKLGKNEVLETNLRKLIKLKPDYAHAYNALGYSLADRGERLDEAQQLIEKALQLAPDDPFILDSKGWLLFRRGDQDGAYAVLNKALTMRPDPEIAAHLGEVLWNMGRRQEAMKTWNDAAKTNPANDVLTGTIKKFVP